MVLKKFFISIASFIVGGLSFIIALKIYRKITKRSTPKKFYFLRSNSACQVCFIDKEPNLCKLEHCSYQLLLDVVNMINQAKKSIVMCSPYFDIMDLSNALVNAAGRGVFVRIIVDNLTDSPEAITTCIDAGIWFKALSTVNLLMHNKFLIVDERILIRGSLNWSMGALLRNHENLQVLQEETHIKWYLDYFNLMWQETSYIHASENLIEFLQRNQIWPR